MKTIVIKTNVNINKDALMPFIIDLLNKNFIPIEDIYITEKEISALPPKRRKPKWPFREMEVGNSIIMCDHYTRSEHQKFGNYARNWAKKSPDCKHYRFTTIRTDDDKIATIRIA